MLRSGLLSMWWRGDDTALSNELELSLVPAHVPNSTEEEELGAPRFGSVHLFKPWFPDVDPEDPRAGNFLRRLSDRNIALLLIQTLSLAIFVFNLSVTAWAMARTNSRPNNFVDILGPDNNITCANVRIYNRWLHLGINALSTLLLGASNYCAQLLAAPTRDQIDKAHARKQWLDIGIQSFRNLRGMDLKRCIAWVSLMLSSGLLHLFWNSAVFAATPFNRYQVGLVTTDFLDDLLPWNNALDDLKSIRNNVTHVKKLTKTECISRYTENTAGLHSLLVVSANISMVQGKSLDTANSNSSLLRNFTSIDMFGSDWSLNNDWMCSQWATLGFLSSKACTTGLLESQIDTWTLQVDWSRSIWSKVDACIPLADVHPMEDKCALRASSNILAIVTALNLWKCICIAYTAYLHSQFSSHKRYPYRARKNKRGVHQLYNSFFCNNRLPNQAVPYIVTIGDAIASFLQEEDRHTTDMDFVSKKDFVKGWPDTSPGARFRKPMPMRWFWAASKKRWCFTVSNCILLIAVVGALLSMSISGQKSVGVKVDLHSLWNYGLGTPHRWALALTGAMRSVSQTSQTKGFFFAILFANMFQVIVSALYLLLNNLLTVMVTASEWNSFIYERKTLRLSSPRGIQRSSFFLSLPYKFSLTLLVLSGLLHWLISQCVFVVQTVAFKTPDFTRDKALDASSIGFSSIGILFAMVTGIALVIMISSIGLACRYVAKAPRDGGPTPPYPMPLVSTCSAAISGNCHRHVEDSDCWLLPVHWGFVSDVKGGETGHFTFTTARDIRYF